MSPKPKVSSTTICYLLYRDQEPALEAQEASLVAFFLKSPL